MFLNVFNEYNKIYIFSPSLHQELYQKLVECFNHFIPTHIVPNVLNEEDIDVVIEEIVHNEDIEKADTEIEFYETIEELKLPQDYDDGGIIILEDLNEKEMNDPRVQSMFKRSRHNIFIFFHNLWRTI